MKLLRLWLLVVLAVLLPVRGAMAAAMLCTPGAGGHGSMQLMGAQPGHGHEAKAHGHDHAAHAHDPAGQGHGSAHHDPSSPDRCSLCAACCSSASLPSTPMAIDAPTATASVAFPAFSAPSPTFQSDGLERPPRST